jgi:aminobenzoyl-glutamate utilization protein B
VKSVESKQDVLTWLEENKHHFTEMADQIWANPEIMWEEFFSSRIQAELLEKEEFKITWDVAGMNTAFIAEWGEGKPIIGFIGEYDALPGLSQKKQPSQEAIIDGGHGHGCGHNLLGTGAVAAAVAAKKWLQHTGSQGTVRYYGCPAEEGGGGKVYMARDGLFDDLQAAFNFHPAEINTPSKGTCVAVDVFTFRFHGQTAHAAAAHNGRSALDAVELMNVGVNYLREHVKDSVRMHYVITNGGQAANIVPDLAEVEYILRAETSTYLKEVSERVRKVAEGAAMMTETSVEIIPQGGFSSLLNNHALADLQFQEMQQIGPINFTEEELAYAQQINDAFPRTNSDCIQELVEIFKPPADIVEVFERYQDQPLIGENFPAIDESYLMKGATDVGDLSQLVPVSMLATACFPTGAPGHSWANVATGGMSIGHKGMIHAAKVMAASAVELFSNPDRLKQVREEFEKKAKPYQCPIPPEMMPPRNQPEG